MLALPDIITSLFGKSYYEVAQDSPIIFTSTTTAQPVLGVTTYKWVLSYLIKVRSMGTATYIGVGNEQSQNWRLTIKGETYGFAGNPKEVTDLSRVYVISDTNDAVIEITALYKPTPMQGDVEIVQRL